MRHIKYRTRIVIPSESLKDEQVLKTIRQKSDAMAKTDAPGFDFFSESYFNDKDDFILGKVTLVREYRDYF